MNNMLDKNMSTINSIIKVLSYRDYIKAWNKLTKKQRTDHMLGRYNFSYSLGNDTRKAYNVKHDYTYGQLSDIQYQDFCAKHSSILERLDK